MYLDDYIQITFQSKPADIPCNVERKDRLCIQCTMSMIEDDYHVPLVCPKYRHLKLFTPSSEIYHAYVDRKSVV